MRAERRRAESRASRASWASRYRYLGALLALGVSAFGADAHAYCRLTTSMPVAGFSCSETGNTLYWPRQCISYSVVARSHAETPSMIELRDVVDRSFGTWLAVQCDGHALGLSLQQTDELSQCDVPTYADDAPNANSVIFVTEWAKRDLPPEAFGLTLVWHDSKSGEIFDADMQLNETLGALSICLDASCEPGEVDLQNIITHEAGHFLGLGHSTQRDACMYGKADVGEVSKRYLSHDDEDGLCAMYGALAAPSCSQEDYTPNNGFGHTCDDPPVANDSDAGGTPDGSKSRSSWMCSAGVAADSGGTRGLHAALALGSALLALVLRTRKRE